MPELVCCSSDSFIDSVFTRLRLSWFRGAIQNYTSMKGYIAMKTFELFVGIDASKGKADAAIYKVPRDRNLKPSFLRKRITFKFVKSDVNQFLSVVRSHADQNCTKVTYAMEVTGIYASNLYEFLLTNLSDNEDVRYLNTQYVNGWRESHHIPKSDPLDAQTIAQVLLDGDKVLEVNKHFYEQKNGYTDLKTLIHRYYQVKKNLTQETNRLINHCDRHFPELQYIFEPKSAVFLAILSAYPTTYDIINASKDEVFDIAYEASKHRCTMDKIDKLFDLCNDTLITAESNDSVKEVTRSLLSNIESIKDDIKSIEALMKDSVIDNNLIEILTSIPGCGFITAVTILAEIIDIKRFSSADKFVAYIGICPNHKRSGSSVDTVGKISKRGSKYLRHAIYMIAEFARRHNPVLKHFFEKIKNGYKKRHKLAVIAVANKVARYVYTMIKHQRIFVIEHNSLMQLPEETRNTFFNNITTHVDPKSRKQIYNYTDENGEIIEFSYKSKMTDELAVA